ncbi:MAG: type VII secretion protein EssC [Anaerorhabdus sp.]|uniref:type VII secretion protein EssC n=1 Tax=Anaerorhabdus sp. TaxID=1872524 RepID=UPI003A8AA1A5
MKIVAHHSSRIYERDIVDGDFCTISVGYTNQQPTYTIDYRNDNLQVTKDNLINEVDEIVKEFNLIKNVPYALDLKKTHIGLLAEGLNVNRQISSMIIQLSVLQSYLDLQIVALAEEKDQKTYEWLKWLPHCKLRQVNLSTVICTENHRDQVLGSITQILKERKNNRDENKDAIVVPHFVFFIANPKLILNHPIMEYLSKDNNSMGFSIVYVTNQQANLPDNIKTILSIDSIKQISVFMKYGELCNEQLKSLQVDTNSLERISRSLAPIIHTKGITSHIPDSITFFELYNIKKPEEIPVEELWNKNAAHKSLAVPIGVRGKDDVVYLNMHEKAHGPHGLVAGTTGSGKSEILQTIILSLAVNFHPYEVGFLLIDYKGGGMANLFNDLPHLLGTITNLDGSDSLRALASIKSELARRQEIFRDSGVNNINQYSKLFKAKEVTKPLPHLFIISDEFAELKKEQPEFMDELISTTRIGRSLGVHLILATQKPTGVVNDQIWSNSKFKLALKVQDASDSNEILKTPDAARITHPGRSYLQVGNNEIYELFQSAYSGAPYSEEIIEQGYDGRIYKINDLGQGELINDDLSAVNTKEDARETELSSLVSLVKNVYKKLDCKEVEKPWLAPLDKKIINAELEEVIVNDELNLSVNVGFLDIPHQQKQQEYQHDFKKEGNYVYFSSSGYGKSTLITNIILSLANKNSSDLVNFYILDFGNSSLIPFKELKHVADYISFDDIEKIRKFIKIINKEIAARKQKFAKENAMNFDMYNQLVEEKLPAIFIFVDNFDVVKELNINEMDEFFTKLTRDGSGVGIYTMLTASRMNSIRYSILNNFKVKSCGFMYETGEYSSIVGRTSFYLPEIKGRTFIRLKETLVMQNYIAVDATDDIDYLEKVKNTIKNITLKAHGGKVPRIPMLPDFLRYSDLIQYKKDSQVILGLDREEVKPVMLEERNMNYLVLGSSQQGKTNVLKIILKQIHEGICFIFDTRSSDFAKDINSNLSYATNKQEVEDLIEKIKLFIQEREEQFTIQGNGQRAKEFYQTLPKSTILIDDADDLIGTILKIDDFADLCQKFNDVGGKIIVSANPSKLKGFDKFTKMLKETKSGLVLSGTD